MVPYVELWQRNSMFTLSFSGKQLTLSPGNIYYYWSQLIAMWSLHRNINTLRDYLKEPLFYMANVS